MNRVLNRKIIEAGGRAIKYETVISIKSLFLHFYWGHTDSHACLPPSPPPLRRAGAARGERPLLRRARVPLRASGPTQRVPAAHEAVTTDAHRGGATRGESTPMSWLRGCEREPASLRKGSGFQHNSQPQTALITTRSIKFSWFGLAVALNGVLPELVQ